MNFTALSDAALATHLTLMLSGLNMTSLENLHFIRKRSPFRPRNQLRIPFLLQTVMPEG